MISLHAGHLSVLRALLREGGTAYESVMRVTTGLDVDAFDTNLRQLAAEDYVNIRRGRVSITAIGRRAAKGR